MEQFFKTWSTRIHQSIYPQLKPVMIHNPIPRAAVVSRSQVSQLYPGPRASGVNKPLLNSQMTWKGTTARTWVHLPKHPPFQKEHPQPPQKSEKKSFFIVWCILLLLCLSLFLKLELHSFPHIIEKSMFVMLLVVLFLRCVVTLERMSVESLGFTGTKETWLMSCVERVLFPPVGRLPRVLQVSSTLQRNTTKRRPSAGKGTHLWLI